MAHCTKCGAALADNAGFCGSCGAPQSAVSSPAATSAAPASGLTENVAGLLCYVLGWVTGLIFFLIDKRPFVRFHAAQSIVTFGGLHIVSIVLGMIFGVGMMMGGLGTFSGGIALIWLLNLICFVLWILLMIKAYQGERFRVPIAADIAEKIFGTA